MYHQTNYFLFLFVIHITLITITAHVDFLSCQPLYTLGGNKHYELMYSLGVSKLHAGKISMAFECFTEAAQMLHNNPKVWLRMAECCIYNFKHVSKQKAL